MYIYFKLYKALKGINSIIYVSYNSIKRLNNTIEGLLTCIPF